jgi:predicted RNA-binding protein with PIN domain
MPFLIDGHNLIPKLGLRLDSIEDEQELVTLLQEYCRLSRKTVEVYFDGAPAPHAGSRKLGSVTAHFVRLESSADEAIRKRLKSMGKSARNWTVVTSDRRVQAEARAAQAEALSSETFAALLKEARATAPKRSEDKKLSKDEVEEWMNLFQRGKPK